MREREIDNLFRKKLETHGESPSQGAWGQIESQLHPDKVTWRFYVGIAASLLLIAVVFVVMWFPNNEVRGTTAEENVPVQEEKSGLKPQSPIENQTAEVVTTETQRSVQTPVEVEEQVERPVTKEQKSTNSPKFIALVVDQENSEPENIPEERETVYTLAKTSGIVGIADDIKISPVALNASQVEIKMPAETDEESSRGINLKKVLDVAKNLKSDNDGWSSLREAKNDLFALGRKKDNKPEEIQD